MFIKSLAIFKKFDWYLFLAIIILAGIGLTAIYTLSVSNDVSDFQNFNRQTIVFVVGILLLFLAAAIDYRFFYTYGFVLYIVGGILLLLVLMFGSTIRGSTAWFSFFGQTFQPVEVAKITLIIFLSKFFADHYTEMFQLKMIIKSALIAVPYLALTILQPDFGSAIILLVIWLGLLVLNKTQRTHILMILVIFVLVTIIGWFFVLQDYQKERMLTFFNPSRDPLGSGYNPTQSIIAVGSGGLFGRGLGLGPQSQLNFLPVAEKDFIFAVIAEELGFFGSILLLSFFVFVFIRLIRVLRGAVSNFSLFLISGVIISIFSQMFINISMNIGLLPITGIPLPFVSYGGSSLLTTLVMVGIIESIIIRQRA